MFGFFKADPRVLLARDMANIIRHTYTRLDVCHRERIEGRWSIDEIQFSEPIRVTEHSIEITIDTLNLPRGVHVADLAGDRVLDSLSAACGRPVRYQRTGGEHKIIVELKKRDEFPLLKFAELKRPERLARLLIPLGIDKAGVQRWENLRELPHLLVGGATNQGKSVLLNVILCHLTQQLGPDELQLVLIDLKGGMEFAFYEGLPHLRRLVTVAGDAPDALLSIQAEMENRTALMKGKARDIDDYNKTADQKLPYILVVIDEVANAMLSRQRVELDSDDGTTRKSSVKLEFEALLADLAARARATGIHLIISTQRPSADVVTGIIKANFPCRIALGTASDVDSRVIIDDGGAAGLPVGRYKFRRNMELIDIKAPLITTNEVQEVVKSISSGTSPLHERYERLAYEIGEVLRVVRDDYKNRFIVTRLSNHLSITSLKIGHNKLDKMVRFLEQRGILARPNRNVPWSVVATVEEIEDWLSQLKNGVDCRAETSAKK